MFVPQQHPAREVQDTFYVKGKSRYHDPKSRQPLFLYLFRTRDSITRYRSSPPISCALPALSPTLAIARDRAC